MWQWTVFNCVFLIIALAALKLKRTKKWFVGSELVLFTAGGINVWIFSQKPHSAGLSYWILPGAIFLIAFFPLWLKRHEYAAKRKLDIR